MKQKVLEKLDILFQMSLFYLVTLCLTFIIAMIIGKLIGHTYLSYSFMTSCLIHMGLFTLCMTLFLTDLVFIHLKNSLRILSCLLSAFALIEGYTIYEGITKTGNPTAYLSHNQMLFIEFFFLLFCWTIYSALSSYRYQKLIITYQARHKQ